MVRLIGRCAGSWGEWGQSCGWWHARPEAHRARRRSTSRRQGRRHRRQPLVAIPATPPSLMPTTRAPAMPMPATTPECLRHPMPATTPGGTPDPTPVSRAIRSRSRRRVDRTSVAPRQMDAVEATRADLTTALVQGPMPLAELTSLVSAPRVSATLGRTSSTTTTAAMTGHNSRTAGFVATAIQTTRSPMSLGHQLVTPANQTRF